MKFGNIKFSVTEVGFTLSERLYLLDSVYVFIRARWIIIMLRMLSMTKKVRLVAY